MVSLFCLGVVLGKDVATNFLRTRGNSNYRSLKMVGYILNSVGELTTIDTINSTAASGQAGESQRIVRYRADAAVGLEYLEHSELV